MRFCRPSVARSFVVLAFSSLLLVSVLPALGHNAGAPAVILPNFEGNAATSMVPPPGPQLKDLLEELPSVSTTGLLADIQAISAGGRHTCALTTAGGVKCWGKNYGGQLGDGTTISRTIPVDVLLLSSGVQAISAGSEHTCALTTAGGVKCWGTNNYGELGNGETTRQLKPVDVIGLETGVQAIAAGAEHTCALTTIGGVKCWGWNRWGQLGDGTNTFYRSSPVDVIGLGTGVQAITAGGASYLIDSRHTCAITAAGGVVCWGENTWGQLGDGTTTDRRTPVNVSDLGSGVRAIEAGNGHTCALTSTGGVKCWGASGVDNWRTPVDVIGPNSAIKAIAVGGSLSCALTTAGGVKCWQGEGSGPVDVVGLNTGVRTISVGDSHACVLTASSNVKCWGDNYVGQLGDGTTAVRTTLVDVIGVRSETDGSWIRIETVLVDGAHRYEVRYRTDRTNPVRTLKFFPYLLGVPNYYSTAHITDLVVQKDGTTVTDKDELRHTLTRFTACYYLYNGAPEPLSIGFESDLHLILSNPLFMLMQPGNTIGLGLSKIPFIGAEDQTAEALRSILTAQLSAEINAQAIAYEIGTQTPDTFADAMDAAKDVVEVVSLEGDSGAVASDLGGLQESLVQLNSSLLQAKYAAEALRFVMTLVMLPGLEQDRADWLSTYVNSFRAGQGSLDAHEVEGATKVVEEAQDYYRYRKDTALELLKDELVDEALSRGSPLLYSTISGLVAKLAAKFNSKLVAHSAASNLALWGTAVNINSILYGADELYTSFIKADRALDLLDKFSVGRKLLERQAKAQGTQSECGANSVDAYRSAVLLEALTAVNAQRFYADGLDSTLKLPNFGQLFNGLQGEDWRSAIASFRASADFSEQQILLLVAYPEFLNDAIALASPSKGDGGSVEQLPVAPELIGTYADYAGGDKLALAGSMLLSVNDGALTILDVTDPNNLRRVSQIVIPDLGYAFDMKEQNGYVYIVSFNQLWTIDISEPSAPSIVSVNDQWNENTGLSSLALASVGDRWIAYLGDMGVAHPELSTQLGGGQIFVMDLTEPANPTLLRTEATADLITALAIDGQNLYTGSSQGRYGKRNTYFQTFARADSHKLTRVSSLELDNSVLSLVADRSFVYLSTSDWGQGGLRIVDTSDSADPVEVTFLKYGQVRTMDLQGAALYLVTDTDIKVLDVSNPRAPTELASVPIDTNAFDIAVKNGILYLTGYDKFYVFAFPDFGLTQPRVTETPTPVESTNANAKVKVGVIVDQLNVRGGPSTDDEILTQVNQQTVLHLLRTSSDGIWLQVKLPDGTEGWVFAEYTDYAGKSEATP